MNVLSAMSEALFQMVLYVVMPLSLYRSASEVAASSWNDTRLQWLVHLRSSCYISPNTVNKNILPHRHDTRVIIVVLNRRNGHCGRYIWSGIAKSGVLIVHIGCSQHRGARSCLGKVLLMFSARGFVVSQHIEACFFACLRRLAICDKDVDLIRCCSDVILPTYRFISVIHRRGFAPYTVL